MKLFVIFNGRFPSEKAASLFAAKNCEAFADEEWEVTLVVPWRFGRTSKDPFAFYKIKKNFTVRYVPTIDLYPLSFLTTLAFYVHFFVFSFSSCVYVLAVSGKDDIIYSNESLPLFFVSFFRKKIFYELHDMPRGKLFFFKRFFKRIKGIVVTNIWKMERLVQDFGIAKDRMLVEMNAVDVEEFSVSETQERAREVLALPSDKKIVLYTGHLYDWKGVDTLAEAARLLPQDVQVYFVGGTEKDTADFKKRFGGVPNITIIGYRDHAEMPLWQHAADVLIVPNTAKEAISKYDTSPMKIFEYMASGRPIIATDIPSIREILGERNAIIVPADDPESMARAIMDVFANRDRSNIIARQAYEDVQTHTWRARAKRIIAFLRRAQ